MNKDKGVVSDVFGKDAVADAVVGGPKADKGKCVVLALFENEAAADAAVDGLKAWDDLDDDVKLNAIGMMVLAEDGKLKMHKVGRRRGIAKGVAGGAVAVLLAGYLVTPLGLPILGGLLGATRKNVPMSDEDRDRLARELNNGKAALAVLLKSEQRDAVSQKLAELGGSPERTLELTPELEAAAAEVPEYEAGNHLVADAPGAAEPG